MQFNLVGAEEGQNLTVIIPGRGPLQAHSSHPNFEQMVEGALAGDESIVDLFDLAQTAGARFERVTDRVTTQNGRLYMDGDEVNNAIATQVVRSIAEGVEDFIPLVNFLENVATNPNDHSREQLANWLDAADYTITEDGMIVGYKGVKLGADGEFLSINSGRAVVDGVVQEGAISNHIGAVVEMPRSEVTHNPELGCHQGLHVGTYEYAEGFAQGALLEVHVHPRDVVSVPTDCGAQKMRVCRYTVVNTIDAPHTVPVLFEDLDFDFEDDEDGVGWMEESGFWGDDEEDLLLDEDEDEEADLVAFLNEVQAGDRFEDTDSRRQGRTFVVEDVDEEFAVGKSLPTNVTRRVQLRRLLSRKYRRA